MKKLQRKLQQEKSLVILKRVKIKSLKASQKKNAKKWH